jgi:16S rRNA (guanine527-N7)-methyltransferase
LLRPETSVDSVSRETIDRFLGLVRKWTKTVQLVARNEEESLADRHVVDALDLAVEVPLGADTLIDIGSGGGFPGIVVAIRRPRLQVTLIESDTRKAAFLNAVRRDLALRNVAIVNQRVEAVAPTRVDVISARALAPLTQLLSLSRHLRDDTTLSLFPKGNAWRDEVLDANEEWRYDLEVVRTGRTGFGPILKIKNVQSRGSVDASD